MRHLLIALAVLFTAIFSVASPVQAGQATYYLSPTGNDSNNGSLASPWLSPNHALNCGDVIVAKSGNYNAGNFGSGKWGAVNCPGNNNVAWVKCEAFDTCKIVTAGNDGMRISSSYWGVQGWEITNTAGSCFAATPPTFASSIHHIIFANNIANGCKSNGFSAYPYYSGKNQSSVDYIEIIGNLAYNAAGGNNLCFSGVSVYEPKNVDTNAGTHIYIAQNIAWGNVDGPTCPGNSDGNGIILDDFNGDQSGMLVPYSGQTVVENNITVGNGSAGIAPFHNTNSPAFVLNNTSYGNYTDPYHQGSYKGEILYNWSSNVVSKYNITHSTVSSGGVSNYSVYSFYVGRSNSTDVVDYNWIYSPFGKNTGINSSTGFVYGTHNIVGVNPAFANPTIPGAPVCSGKANTLDCMSGVIAGYVPSAAIGYGYKPVDNNYIQNDYYPLWLCNVSLPDGIMSNYCSGVPVPTNTPTVLPVNTPTLIPTVTNTPVPTNTPMPTLMPTNTVAPTSTNTSTSTPIPTNTATEIPTLMPTETSTSTLIPTEAPTLIPVSTRTPECITVTFSDGVKISVCEE
jgi:hypothetical protein